MSDSLVDVPKKPAAAKKKPAPRVSNPLENLHLKSSKRGSILPPERYALETQAEQRKRAPVKKASTSTKKKVEKKKVEKKKVAPKKSTTTVKKPNVPKKSNVVNNVSPVIAVAAS